MVDRHGTPVLDARLEQVLPDPSELSRGKGAEVDAEFVDLTGGDSTLTPIERLDALWDAWVTQFGDPFAT